MKKVSQLPDVSCFQTGGNSSSLRRSSDGSLILTLRRHSEVGRSDRVIQNLCVLEVLTHSVKQLYLKRERKRERHACTYVCVCVRVYGCIYVCVRRSRQREFLGLYGRKEEIKGIKRKRGMVEGISNPLTEFLYIINGFQLFEHPSV